ncbi:MAG TPA: hypothetical protein PKY30_25720 [Myxococcota bacterium]|nr:hypothetical protein [Myxococcota bacterium]HNH50457.1 hypothetical protein [Myxococcota bacterium]
MWLWLLLSCAGSPATPTPGSRAERLLAQVAQVESRAATLAERAEALEGRFDAFRAAPPDEQARIQQEIEAEARALHEESQALAEQVRQIELATAVYPR